MLPNFICPGAPKAATTTLYEILKQHPDIFLPSVKETGFFSFEKLYRKGMKWYDKEFYSNADKYKVIGDVSTAYMTYAKIAARNINDTLGSDVKFIFMLRNPVDRAYSHYCMRKYNNAANEPTFSTIVDALTVKKIYLDTEKISKLSVGYSYIERENLDKWRYLSYFYTGLYSKIIKEYLKYFPIQKMKFVIFEEFLNNRKKVTESIFEFLEVKRIGDIIFDLKSNESGRIRNLKMHKMLKFLSQNKYISSKLFKIFGYSRVIKGYYKFKNFNRELNKPPAINKKTGEKLQNFYKNDVEELQGIINFNLSSWLEKY